MKHIAVGLTGMALCSMLSCAPRTPADAFADFDVSQQFPARAELEALATTPLPPTKPHEDVAVVERWTLAQTQPDMMSPDQKPWVEALLAAVAKKPHVAAAPPSLRCFAEQVGRFQLVHDKKPDQGLQRFMAGHCGVPTDSVVSLVNVTVIPDDVPSEKIFEVTGKTLAGELDTIVNAALPPGATRLMGIWFGRSEGKVAVSTALAVTRVLLAPLAISDAGRVAISGRLGVSGDELVGMINQGPNGVALCEPDRNTTMPNFKLFCPLMSGDPHPWAELALRRKGHLLAHSVALFMVKRGNTEAVSYAPPAAPPAANDAEFRTRAIAAVNARRTQAGLAAMLHASAQSVLNQKLASHFFAAFTGGDDATEDRIALGLLAGHDVQGTIRLGDLFASFLSGPQSPEAWVDYTLTRPLGRYTLLEPTMAQIAVGTTVGGPVAGTGAVVSTYAFFSPQDHTKGVADLIAGLTPRARSPRQARAGALQQCAVATAGRSRRGRQASRPRAPGGHAAHELRCARRDLRHRHGRQQPHLRGVPAGAPHRRQPHRGLRRDPHQAAASGMGPVRRPRHLRRRAPPLRRAATAHVSAACARQALSPNPSSVDPKAH